MVREGERAGRTRGCNEGREGRMRSAGSTERVRNIQGTTSAGRQERINETGPND